MASVDKRSDGSYRARWREYASGPQKTRQFSRKIDAERFLTEVRHGLLSGTYVDPVLGKTTVEEYAEVWKARQHWRPSTRSVVESHLARHIVPVLGPRPLGSVKRADVEAWARALELAPSTVATVRQHLGQLFNAAVEDGLIARNPAVNAKMPRGDAVPARALTVAQVEALTAAAPPPFKVALALGVGAGLRQSEATGLGVDGGVDFLRRSLRVSRQLVTPSKGPAELGPPKTDSSNRSVPLAGWVVAALAEHVRIHGVGVDGLVLHTESGAPLSRNRFGDLWRATASRAKLDGVRFHDCRHTYASTLLSNGVSIAAVAEWLGHSSASTTLNVYAHMMPKDDDRARRVLDEAFAHSAEDWLRTSGLVS